MVRIFCVNNGETKNFQSGTTLLQISKEFSLGLSYEAVAALVNNEVKGLDFRVYNHKDVEFLDITSDDGMRMYVRSLTFVMMKALNELFPGQTVRFENPISKGYYCRLDGEIDEAQVAQVRELMQQIIDEDTPFHRVDCRTSEAIEIFENLGREDRVRLLKTYNYLYTSYYKLGDYIDHYYEGLLPSAGYIKVFEIEKFADGVLLRVPNQDCPTTLEDKVPQEKLQERFRERLRWHQIMGVETIGDFNLAMNLGHEVDLVNIAEALQEKSFSAMADAVKERGARVVLIAGPSSSGKTTSSKRLSVHLLACGLKPVAVSLDDFFVDREKSPRKPNGEYDFESIYSIDLPYFNETLTRILSGEEVELPYYNFVTGRREYRGNKIKLNAQMVLVIEGTHGLNPMLTQQVPEKEKFRIYVSALTSMKLDYHNYISTSDTRLLRRIIRDAKYRGFSAVETINRWPSVRAGEEVWIFPYQENADVMFNSSLLYELAAFKSQAEPMLRAVPQTCREYSVARRLLRFLDYIVPLRENILPLTSVMREFLGGSTFTY